jgi:hypothetical protein
VRCSLLILALLAGCSEWTIRGSGGDVDTEGPAEEPIADAGADVQTVPLTAMRLDGSGSSDPADLQIIAYRWTMLSSPPGSIAMLSNPDDDQPFFEPDVSGEYEFELTVMNSREVWDSTPDRVIVDASPNAGVYVQLTWDSEFDLDLHVTQNNAPLFSTPGDLNWCNPVADWGAPDFDADDGVLVEETSSGFGPEIATIADPAPGTYTLQAHYYGKDGGRGCDDLPCGPSIATLRVFIDGVEVQEVTQTLTDAQQVWRAATITWPGGVITPLGNIITTSEFTCF